MTGRDDPPTPSGLDTALGDVAARHNCTVLAARDVGSRAWNLHDAGSDYDVAFLFVQEPAAYATLDEYVANVEERASDDLELTGWNVSRFAELLVDSNPTVLEFLHTPLRYREHAAVTALERDVADRFTPIRVYHHYRSLAANQYRTYLQRRLFADGKPTYVVVEERGDEYLVRPVDDPGGERETIPADAYEEGTTDRTVKRNLYAVRAVLYARYVLETHAFPDLDFPVFLDREGDRFEPDLVETARELTERKRAGEDDAVVGDLIGPEHALLPGEVDPEEHAVRGIDRERVNEFVRAVIE